MSDAICSLHRGSAPLLISLPHDGTALPQELAARMTPEARRVPDTDWHVSRLYAFAREFGASTIRPDGELDRPALGALVFGDPDAVARLNGIVQPAPAAVHMAADLELQIQATSECCAL